MVYHCPVCGRPLSDESAAEYEQLRDDLAELQARREGMRRSSPTGRDRFRGVGVQSAPTQAVVDDTDSCPLDDLVK